MTDSGYVVILRLSHPFRSPDEVTSVLCLDPDRCWEKGAARNSPDGTFLAGFYKDSHWMKCLADHVSHDLSMAKFLSGLVERLNESSEFFQDWYADGGNTEFEVMWRVGDDAWPQESFNHKLFARLADMKIDLSLQVIIAEKDTTDGHVK